MKFLLDDTPLTFGKHQGETPNEIADTDPAYVVWLFDNLDKKVCTKKLRDACEDTSCDSWEAEKEIDGDFGYDGW